MITLGEIGKWGSGGTPARSNSSFYSGSIPWFKTGELGPRFIYKSEEHISEEAIKSSSAKIFPAGSIALAMYGATIGKTSILGVDAATNQACAVVVEDSYLTDKNYLYNYLKSQKEKFIAAGQGGAQPNISQTVIKAWPFPLAPLREQRRIADKLDTVLTRVDAVQDRLARITPLLKRFRQSILAAATSGRLTEEWRGGRASEWRYLRADEACEKVQSGGTPKTGFSENGIPFFKVYNIVNQAVDFDYRPQYVAKELHDGELRKSKVQPFDVLMNIVGPPLGKVAIVPEKYDESNINQAITLFRASSSIKPDWIYIVLCEGAPIRAVLTHTKGSVGQINISLSQCRAFEIPVPSLEEQTEIIRRVDLLMGYADRLEARLQAAQTAAERLTPALLAKAFRGELVPQDPSDEPATKLLRRLREARATQAPAKPKRARKSSV